MGKADWCHPQFRWYSNVPYGRMWWYLEMGLDNFILNPTDAGPFSFQAPASPHQSPYIEQQPCAFRAVTGNTNYPREVCKHNRNCWESSFACCDPTNCPLLCSEETSFPPVEQLLSQLCIIFIQSPLRRKERGRPWEVITAQRPSRSPRLLGRSSQPASQPLHTQALRACSLLSTSSTHFRHLVKKSGSVPSHLGFATRLWGRGGGGTRRIRGIKKHGLLARLGFWRVLCVIEDSQNLGPWRSTNSMTANPMRRGQPCLSLDCLLRGLV